MNNKTTTGTLILIAAVLACAPAMGVSGQARKQRTPPIVFDVPVSGAVPVVGGGSGTVSYVLEVPDTVFGLDIQIENAPADLDILIYNQDRDLVDFSELTLYNERLQTSRIHEPALASGTYVLEIAYQYSQPPRVDGIELTEIPYDLTVRAQELSVTDRLRPGRTVRDTLTPEDGMVLLYQIDVPTGTRALRIDISDTDGDLDLFLNRDEPVASPFESDFWAQTIRSTESLIIDRRSNPPLRPGTYFLMVIDQLDDSFPTDFTLSVTGSNAAPDILARPVEIPRPASDSPLDRAIISTVEVLTENGGGSGVVVSADGHILTNWHVVMADSGLPSDDITIGFALDPARPAEELFRAEVIESAPDRDLALLQITSGRYDQPLPLDAAFPFLELRDTSTVQLGEALQMVGYPSIGGTGSRATVTYTRGVVAGFQRVPFGTLIKTDGEINEGSSGGASLDSAFRLVGLPTEVVGLDAGQIAYVYPVSAIPPRWRQIITR